MSNGGAQFQHLYLGSSFAGFYIDFYAAGTTTPKNVWIDESKNTAVQTITADSNGMAYWYADGDYDLVVKDNSGVTLWTFPNVKITSDTATMWEGNFGTSYPTASSANKWQSFLKVDGSNIVEQGINNGSSFQSVFFASGYQHSLFPSAGQAGRIIRATDNVRGIWMDTGSQFFHLGLGFVNVQEFGAKADGSDDTIAINNAIQSAGSYGVVFFPPGTYTVADELYIGDENNNYENITLLGYGAKIVSTSTTNVLRIGHATSTTKNVQQSQVHGFRIESSTAKTLLMLTGSYTERNGIKDLTLVGNNAVTQGICVTDTGLGTYFNSFENIRVRNCTYNISIGYDWGTLTTAVSGTNAQRFKDIINEGFATYGVYMKKSVGNTYSGDFNAANVGASADVYLQSTGSSSFFQTRNESGASESYYIESGSTNSTIIIQALGSTPAPNDQNTTIRNIVLGIVSGNAKMEAREIRPKYITLGQAGENILFNNGTADVMDVGGHGVGIKKRISYTSVTFSANDATPDVSGGDIFKTSTANTAPLTITGFTNQRIGQIITIIGSGGANATTLQDGTNLKLAGNWTDASNSTITIIFDGTVWYEKSRSTN